LGAAHSTSQFSTSLRTGSKERRRCIFTTTDSTPSSRQSQRTCGYQNDQCHHHSVTATSLHHRTSKRSHSKGRDASNSPQVSPVRRLEQRPWSLF
jgi:hypothetical protein